MDVSSRELPVYAFSMSPYPLAPLDNTDTSRLPSLHLEIETQKTKSRKERAIQLHSFSKCFDNV